MSTEQKQQYFIDILKNAYDASIENENITLEEIMKRLEGELSVLIGN